MGSYAAAAALQVGPSPACPSVCSRPRRCSYSMLSAGKVRVTVWNYVYGGGGGRSGGPFPRPVQTAEARFGSASHPRCMSSAAGVRGLRCGIGMECSFPVQGPVSKEAQRSFETTNELFFFFFFNSPSSVAPALLLAAHQSNSRR